MRCPLASTESAIALALRSVGRLCCVVISLGCHQSHRVGELDGALGDVRFESDARVDARTGVDAHADTAADADGCREAFELEGLWPNGSVDRLPSFIYVATTPLWADFDDDGIREVAFISADLELKRGVLRILDEGRVWTGDEADLSPTDNLAAGDLDGDGDLEIVAVRSRWGMRAYDHRAGPVWFSRYPTLPAAFGGESTTLPGLPRSRTGAGDVIGPEYIHRSGGGASIHDLDADGRGEVIFGGMVLEGETGELRWSGHRLDGWMGTNHVFGPFSCVVDVDGDGRDDVVVGGEAYSADGARLWTTAREYDGFCAVGEIDGRTAVVVVDRNELWIRDGATGEELAHHRTPGRAIGGFGGVGGPAAIADFAAGLGVAVATNHTVRIFDPTCPSCSPDQYDFEVPLDGLGGGTPIQSVMAFDVGDDGVYELLIRTRDRLMLLDGDRLDLSVPTQAIHLSANPIPVDLENDGELELLIGIAPWRDGDEPDAGLAVVRRRCEPLSGHVTSVVSHGFGSRFYRAIPGTP